ncbi:hypothetical protein [Enterococcus sp. CSURQ0835]|nr:hypothetical protein [Enterococcus sp. CSURQ0835]
MTVTIFSGVIATGNKWIASVGAGAVATTWESIYFSQLSKLAVLIN